jgi:hypothetical protein
MQPELLRGLSFWTGWWFFFLPCGPLGIFFYNAHHAKYTLYM